MGNLYFPALFVLLILIHSIVCEDVTDFIGGNVRQGDIHNRHARSVSGVASDTRTAISDVSPNYLARDCLPVVHRQHHGSMEAQRVTRNPVRGKQLRGKHNGIEDVTDDKTEFLERRAYPDTLAARLIFPSNEAKWVLPTFTIWLMIIASRYEGKVSRFNVHALSGHLQKSIVLVALIMGNKCNCQTSIATSTAPTNQPSTTDYTPDSNTITDQTSPTMSTESTDSSAITDQSTALTTLHPEPNSTSNYTTVSYATSSSGSTESPKTTEPTKQTPSPKPTDPEKSQNQALIIGVSCALGAVAIGCAGGLIFFFSKKNRNSSVSPGDLEGATAHEEHPAVEGQAEHDDVHENPAFSTTN